MSAGKGRSGRERDGRRPRRASMPSASPGGAGARSSRGGRAAATRSMSRAVGRLAMTTAERDASTRARASQHRAPLSRTLRLNDRWRNNLPIRLPDMNPAASPPRRAQRSPVEIVDREHVRRRLGDDRVRCRGVRSVSAEMPVRDGHETIQRLPPPASGPNTDRVGGWNVGISPHRSARPLPVFCCALGPAVGRRALTNRQVSASVRRLCLSGPAPRRTASRGTRAHGARRARTRPPVGHQMARRSRAARSALRVEAAHR